MSQKDESIALLPTGFVDLLPPQAQAEADAVQILLNHFSSFGYSRIKPPLLEFEEGLFAPGPGERVASETFRLMDPVSHRMMGIRSDITPQIARIVSSRLDNENRPLRLMYANDVLRIRSSKMRTERQFTQVGCELVGGVDGIASDIEICVLAITGAKAIGVETLTLDLTIPGLVDEILSSVEAEQRDAILKAVAQRDSDFLDGLNDHAAILLARVMNACGTSAQALKKLKDIPLPENLAFSILRLDELVQGVSQALEDLGVSGVVLSIDLLEQEGFEYHKGFGFTLYSEGMRGELGRGGAYNMKLGEKDEGALAKGFTLYMDTLSKAYHPDEENKNVFVSCTESWSVIKDIQARGFIVVRGLDAEDTPKDCAYIYKDGDVVAL